MNPAEDYIVNQPEPYRSILLHLQVIVETTIPEIDLLYKYRIPFYYYKKRPFSYLNASHKRNYVDISFVRANQLSGYKDVLITEKRKVMGSLRYQSVDEIDDVVLIEILKEAQELY